MRLHVTSYTFARMCLSMCVEIMAAFNSQATIKLAGRRSASGTTTRTTRQRKPHGTTLAATRLSRKKLSRPIKSMRKLVCRQGKPSLFSSPHLNSLWAVTRVAKALCADPWGPQNFVCVPNAWVITPRVNNVDQPLTLAPQVGKLLVRRIPTQLLPGVLHYACRRRVGTASKMHKLTCLLLPAEPSHPGNYLG